MKTRMLMPYWGHNPDLLYAAQSSVLSRYADYSPSQQLDMYESAKLLRNTKVGTLAFDGVEAFNSSNYGRTRQNACFHSKIHSVNLPFFRWGLAFNSLQGYLEPYYRLPSTGIPPITKGMLQHMNVSELSPVRRRAYWNMVPKFESDVNLAVSLFELKDFRDCARFVFSAGWFSKLQDLVSRAWGYKSLRKRPSKRDDKGFSPTKTAASGILLNNLMLQPTYQDVRNIITTSCLAAVDAQNRFQQKGLNLNTSYYREPLCVVDQRTVGTYNGYWRGNGLYRDTVFNATMRYRYNYAMRSPLQAFMKYWGLAGSFDAFWNWIPFSFVEDYFLTVSKAIHAMEVDPNVDFFYADYTESLLTRVNSGYSIVGDQRSKGFVIDGKHVPPGRSNGCLLAGHGGTLYERFVRDPDKGLAQPRFRLPSGKQALNCAALVRCLLG